MTTSRVGNRSFDLSDATPYRVIVDGKMIRGWHYHLGEVTGEGLLSEKRAALEERRRLLTARFGTSLPRNWEECSDEEIPRMLAYEANEQAGWLTVDQIVSLLGVSGKRREVADWLRSNQWEAVSHPLRSTLFRAGSFSDFTRHEQFAELLEMLVPDSRTFLARCAFDENARAFFLAEAIGK